MASEIHPGTLPGHPDFLTTSSWGSGPAEDSLLGCGTGTGGVSDSDRWLLPVPSEHSLVLSGLTLQCFSPLLTEHLLQIAHHTMSPCPWGSPRPRVGSQS